MRIAKLKKRHMTVLVPALLYFAFVGAWLADVKAYPPNVRPPAALTSTDSYKTTFTDLLPYVKGRPGQTKKEAVVFMLNPLVLVIVEFELHGNDGALGYDGSESIRQAMPDWGNLILFSGIWFTAVMVLYWLIFGEIRLDLSKLRLPTDPRHPIWAIVKIGVSFVVLISILSFNASEFDKTEVISITMFILALLGIDGAHFAKLRKTVATASESAESTPGTAAAA